MLSREVTLHRNCAQWIRLQHPEILFRTDMGGVQLSRIQAILAKSVQHSRAWPDIFFPEPRGEYHGLFVELKDQLSGEVKRSGEVGNSQHIKEQRAVLEYLESRGYRAVFCVGMEDFMDTVNGYLKGG